MLDLQGTHSVYGANSAVKPFVTFAKHDSLVDRMSNLTSVELDLTRPASCTPVVITEWIKQFQQSQKQQRRQQLKEKRTTAKKKPQECKKLYI